MTVTPGARTQESKFSPVEDSCDSCSDVPEKETSEATDEPKEKHDGHSKVSSLTSTLLVYVIGGNLMLQDVMCTLTFQMLDTTKWELDRLSIRLNYAQTMISGLFFSGAVEYNSTKKHDIVLMGVAGGVINNFLRTMPNQVLNITAIDIDPVMKRIAERWFEFEESPLSRIIVEDGIVYAEEAAKKGETYDAVLLDLSDNQKAELIAPIKEFLTDKVAATLSSILKESGSKTVREAFPTVCHDKIRHNRTGVHVLQNGRYSNFKMYTIADAVLL
ncbi:hypothetical protein ANCCEY_08130 [Ancylostoma ceylanicum]|uniref:PABS domain-containing protein n=1 Tax=Ancylostoma ceylanicum TaxID=53326 RepID=A0A0D6LLN3_9BILA|nr:hypothetical protein ANCCEY_08130 [Ancylostoma ceylanicum]